MKQIAALFGTLVGSTLMGFIGCLFNGWVWLMAYNLGIMPIISQFTTAPTLTYGVFAMLSVVVALIKCASKKEESENFTEAFGKIFGVVFTKLIYVLLIYALNLLFFA